MAGICWCVSGFGVGTEIGAVAGVGAAGGCGDVARARGDVAFGDGVS
jgi:hypothetical protein